MLPVGPQREAVRSGSATAASLVSGALERARADAYGAWVCLDDSAARAAAEQDAAGRQLPLAGVTVGVKDLFAVAGLPRRAGSRVTSDRPSEADAAAVARLRELGAAIVGTTTMPEFAFGPTPGARNPLDPRHTPGSSSAGSAIAVAAGQVAVGLATQTNGSIIRPAAFCGVAGFKPSQGAIAGDGMPLMVPTLDQAGLMAADAESLLSLWSLWQDAEAAAPPVRPALALVRTRRWDICDCATRSALEDIIEAAGGGELVLPAEFDDAWSWIATIIAVELAQNVSGYTDRFEDFSEPIRQAIRDGEATSATRYADALAGRDAWQAWTAAHLDGVDAVLTPAAPGPAPLLEDGSGSPDLCTLWSLAGVPSLTIPLRRRDGELPRGLQLVTATGRDLDLLALAHRWQQDPVSDHIASGETA